MPIDFACSFFKDKYVYPFLSKIYYYKINFMFTSLEERHLGSLKYTSNDNGFYWLIDYLFFIKFKNNSSDYSRANIYVHFKFLF